MKTKATDNYPRNIEFEIDRNQLRNYLQAKWLWSWTSTLGVLGALLAFAVSTGKLKRTPADSMMEGALVLLGDAGTGLLISTLIGIICYLVCSHWLAARMARKQSLLVDGAHLRIKSDGWVRSDYKIHFGAVVDYVTLDTWLMRKFGIQILAMTTTAGGLGGTLNVIGLKDAGTVRDQLSEIDRLREHAASH